MKAPVGDNNIEQFPLNIYLMKVLVRGYYKTDPILVKDKGMFVQMPVPLWIEMLEGTLKTKHCKYLHNTRLMKTPVGVYYKTDPILVKDKGKLVLTIPVPLWMEMLEGILSKLNNEIILKINI